MSKKTVIGCIYVLGILLLAGYCFKMSSAEKVISYQSAVDKVYSSDINGMAVVISKASDLHGRDSKVYFTATGSKDDGFSENSREGVKLWAAKQLFLNLKNLQKVSEGLPEVLDPRGRDYFIIQTNQDYSGKSPDNIYYLSMFVDTKNYHIYIPKEYFTPDQLMSYSTIYMEYEPNEITKTLIEDIIKL